MRVATLLPVLVLWCVTAAASDFTPLTATTGTFTRSTKAYLFDPADQTMDEYAVDAVRTRTLAVANTSDGALTQLTTPGSCHIGPQCNDGTYFYAVADNNAGTFDDVWRCPMSSDPTLLASWTEISTDIDAENIWYLESADMLLAAATVGATGIVLYWSDDLGVNWTACTIDSGAFTPTEVTTSFRGWELGQSTGGTYIIPRGVGNGAAGSEPELIRSTDGKDWTSVLTKEADRDPGAANNHFHVCVWHGNYTGGARWWAIGGDGKYNRWHYYSDDDGANWTNAGPLYNQPVQLLDYGDGQYLLAGNDSTHGISLFDSQTGYTAAVTDLATDRRGAFGYTFLLVEAGGVYYRCSYSTDQATAVATVWVSTNRSTWAPYHQFAAGTGGLLRYAGATTGGTLLFGYIDDGANYDDWKMFTISPAQVVSHAAALLEPTTTNHADTACARCTAGWAATDSSVVSFPTTSPPYGSAFARVTGDAADASILLYDTVASLTIAFGGSDLYFSVSSLLKNQFSMNSRTLRFRRDGGAVTDEAAAIADKAYSSNEWHEMYWAPSKCEHAAATNVTHFDPRFDIEPIYNDTPEWESVLDMACFQIEEGVGTTWMDPAENSGVRTDDEIAWSSLTLAEEWTTTLDVRPHHPKYHLDRGYYSGTLKDFWICSWIKGNAAARLWYDTSAATFVLDYDSDQSGGFVAEATITSAAVDWTDQWHQFRFVVRAESSGTKLSIDYGTGVAHYAVATAMTGLLSQSSASIQNGDSSDHSANATEQLPLLWVEGKLYPKSFTDTEVETGLLRPSYRAPTAQRRMQL